MSEGREPMAFINWREVRRRWSRLGFALVAGLYYLAILALIFEALHIALYVANPPGAGSGHVNRIHAASLVSLEAASVWFLTLVRKQRRVGEWSSLLTLFVLPMVSYIAFRLTEPAPVTEAKTAAEFRCGSEAQDPPAAKPAVLKRR